AAGCAVKINEAAAVGADPDIPVFIFRKTVHILIMEAGAAGRFVRIKAELAHAFSKVADPSFVGAAPDDAEIVFIQGIDGVLRNTFFIIFLIQHKTAAKPLFVDHIDPAVVRAYPYQSLLILDDAVYDIIIEDA